MTMISFILHFRQKPEADAFSKGLDGLEPDNLNKTISTNQIEFTKSKNINIQTLRVKSMVLGKRVSELQVGLKLARRVMPFNDDA